MHGGSTPRGLASPNYKHGRYSKVLPARLADTYDRARKDPDLLNLSAEIALWDTRIGDLVSALQSSDGADPSAWSDLRKGLEVRRRLVESEARRQRDLSAVLQADRVIELVHAIAECVRRHVTDRQALSRIQDDFTRLLSVGGIVKNQPIEPAAVVEAQIIKIPSKSLDLPQAGDQETAVLETLETSQELVLDQDQAEMGRNPG